MKKTSLNGRKFITQWEGEILHVYRDPIGLPTVGVGHLVTPRERDKFPLGKKISREESQAILTNDLKRFEDAVNSLVKVPLTQNQFDALVSFALNVGEKALERSTVLKRLNAKNYTGAANALMSWVRAGGKRLDGLVNRRAAEKALFLKLDRSDPVAATVVAADPLASTASDVVKDAAKGFDLGAVTDTVLNKVTSTTNKIGEIQAGVSRSESLTKLASKAGTGILSALTIVFVDYWFVTVPIILVLIAVSLYLAHKHKLIALGYKTSLSQATEITTLYGS